MRNVHTLVHVQAHARHFAREERGSESKFTMKFNATIRFCNGKTRSLTVKVLHFVKIFLVAFILTDVAIMIRFSV